MWPLLWKGIVVFIALAFISSVFKHRPTQKSGFCTSALLLLLLIFFWKEVLYSLCSEKWCSLQGGWAQLPLLLCVCVFSTPVKHRNSDFSGFKVPPFSFNTQSGIFSEPWTDAVLPQVHRAAFPQADPCWEFCLIPYHGTWASLSIPSSLVFWSLQKNGGVRGETPARGVLHVVVGMRSQKRDQMPSSAFSRASSMFLE